MSYNTTLDNFLMFYSQSEAGNGLTRGLETELSRLTYVPTKLDNELTDAINFYRLVILTGNAGDGKTAFIQKVEEMAENHGSVVHRNNHLGSEFVLNGKKFLTLYDGSMETGGNTNQEMLQQFFAEFAGDTVPTTSTCLIVAMNEGKLRDFLSNTAGFRWLSVWLNSSRSDYVRRLCRRWKMMKTSAIWWKPATRNSYVNCLKVQAWRWSTHS